MVIFQLLFKIEPWWLVHLKGLWKHFQDFVIWLLGNSINHLLWISDWFWANYWLLEMWWIWLEVIFQGFFHRLTIVIVWTHGWLSFDHLPSLFTCFWANCWLLEMYWKCIGTWWTWQNVICPTELQCQWHNPTIKPKTQLQTWSWVEELLGLLPVFLKPYVEMSFRNLQKQADMQKKNCTE